MTNNVLREMDYLVSKIAVQMASTKFLDEGLNAPDIRTTGRVAPKCNLLPYRTHRNVASGLGRLGIVILEICLRGQEYTALLEMDFRGL